MPPKPRSRSGGHRPHQRPGGSRPGGPGQGRFAPPPSSGVPKMPESKEEAIEVDGAVSAVLAGTMFRVTLRNGHTVLAHISGKMRKKFIRLVIGDNVRLEMSQYDPDKARIVYRL